MRGARWIGRVTRRSSSRSQSRRVLRICFWPLGGKQVDARRLVVSPGRSRPSPRVAIWYRFGFDGGRAISSEERRRLRMARGPETQFVSSEGVRRRRVGNCYETSPYSSSRNAARTSRHRILRERCRRESTVAHRASRGSAGQKSIEAPQGAKEGHGRRTFGFFFRPLRGSRRLPLVRQPISVEPRRGVSTRAHGASRGFRMESG